MTRKTNLNFIFSANQIKNYNVVTSFRERSIAIITNKLSFFLDEGVTSPGKMISHLTTVSTALTNTNEVGSKDQTHLTKTLNGTNANLAGSKFNQDNTDNPVYNDITPSGASSKQIPVIQAIGTVITEDIAKQPAATDNHHKSKESMHYRRCCCSSNGLRYSCHPTWM